MLPPKDNAFPAFLETMMLTMKGMDRRFRLFSDSSTRDDTLVFVKVLDPGTEAPTQCKVISIDV
jgi:hypothetical protein